MKELLKYELPDGGSVLVEVDDEDPGFDRAARGADELAADTGKQLKSALAVVGPTASAIVEQVRDLAKRPQEVEVQFGLKLNFKAGAVIASTQAEGHFQVTLKWTNLT